MSAPLKVLDLGCGNKKRVGAVGIDFNSRTQQYCWPPQA